ncbi:hypothetical protein BKP45_04860 [Anaerobacillus alkalidiazotrophicus]|uniref:Uncharacterized protein n=1 Tax=Anaerobacillus alkalidiazotrophicus TaxID=472963 RepID=A0A1S2MBQ2_9BACI|nr:hypothetical protein [Anaerobacillus alkalidiazotrophicus]OIJ22010.1 hypothetical protein BKP45_04860 [Anaerobacillus alkalidiazotrophicus]
MKEKLFEQIQSLTQEFLKCVEEEENVMKKYKRTDFETIQMKREILIIQEKMKAIKDKEFLSYFNLLDGPELIEEFISVISNIPDEEKYEIFLDVYTRSEYSFEVINDDFIEDVCNARPFECREELYKKLDEISATDEIVIYRGMGSTSAPPAEALSWTLSVDVAKWFARRFLQKGGVYKAKIKKRDVVDYYNGRQEEEIIVKRRKVYDLEFYLLEDI